MATATYRVDEQAAKSAIEALVEALGEENVLTSEEGLREYRDPYDYKGSDEYTGSAVVTPRSVEDVQTIVRVANELKVPLWTFGQGRNYTYGGPAPRVRGSILVSFREMNRVLEVDDELAYAVVEPGVRFFDLYDHLQAGGYRLWPSIPDLGWGSVVGNTLDNGRGYTPYGDHPTTQCGLEVVLANGELLRTGVGGMTGAKTWHLYRESFGPSHAGLFSQSNFGIVTKMGIWLMRTPELYVSGWAIWSDDDAAAGVIDTLRELMFEGVVRNYPLCGYGIATDNAESDEPCWSLRFALYGRAALVEAQWEIVRNALESISGVKVGRRTFPGADRAGVTLHDDKVQSGVPGMELMDIFKQRRGEEAGHIDLSTIGPLSGRDVVESIEMRRELAGRHGIPYAAGILLLPRSVLHISSLVFDTNDEQETRARYDAYGKMVVELAKAGYPIYRTNIQHMDLVAEQFDYNGHAQRRLNEALKDLFDPNGILSPGKQGIWPRHLRAERGA